MDANIDLIWQLIDQARLRPGERYTDANKPEVRQAWADALGIPYREDTRPRPVGVFYAALISLEEERRLPVIRDQSTTRERAVCKHPHADRRNLRRAVGGCPAVCLQCGGYLRW